jgi:tetratricopeptide (TPR) repeat protein
MLFRVILRLLILCLACLASAGFAASSNRLEAVDHASAPPAATNDPVEVEYRQLMEADDAALAEIDVWLKDNQKFSEQGAGVPRDEMNRRIMKRVEPVRAAYDDFIKRNPKHARARLVYASFLEDIGEPDAALEQMLKAKEVEPSNPAAWNNLANYYGHYGPPTNAFAHYEKAIELDPKESVYYHNLANTVFLFRTDAKAYYSLNEQQVFDKALCLFSNSLSLDPSNFLLASDIAMTYYGIKPPRTDQARAAWNYALKLASDSLQREGVQIHLARIELNAGHFAEARRHLDIVTNAELADLKARVLRNIEAKEHPAPATPTNSVPAPAPAAASAPNAVAPTAPATNPAAAPSAPPPHP